MSNPLNGILGSSGGGSGGSGDVVGPASSTDNAIARFDGATGKLIQNSGVTVADGLTGGVIVGSTGATDNAILRADGTGGSTAQSSGWTIDDSAVLKSSAGPLINPVSSTRLLLRSGSTDIDLYSNDRVMVAIGGQPGATQTTATELRLPSGSQFSFSSSGTNAASADTGLARSAAGVVKVTDGSTGIRGLLGGGTAVASATAMPLPTGRVFHVTGTTAITSITSTNFQAGAVITLIFDDVLTFTDGNNLKLAGDFTTSADDTITLAYDGTNWYECSRSVN